MLMVAGCLSVIASRLSGLCLSNHGLAPVANEFHAFGTVWPGSDGAGLLRGNRSRRCPKGGWHNDSPSKVSAIGLAPCRSQNLFPQYEDTCGV